MALYGIKENKCLEEITGQTATLEGQLTIAEAASWVYINWPEGFNKDNCVVLSAQIGIKSGGQTDTWEIANYMGMYPICVRLDDSRVDIQVNDQIPVSSGETAWAKVVLMKTEV